MPKSALITKMKRYSSLLLNKILLIYFCIFILKSLWKITLIEEALIVTAIAISYFSYLLTLKENRKKYIKMITILAILIGGWTTITRYFADKAAYNLFNQIEMYVQKDCCNSGKCPFDIEHFRNKFEGNLYHNFSFYGYRYKIGYAAFDDNKKYMLSYYQGEHLEKVIYGGLNKCSEK